MPILDKITFKNPLLMSLNRHGWFNIRNPLYPIVNRQFTERKQHWEDTKGRPSDRETLSDKFLLGKKGIQRTPIFNHFNTVSLWLSLARKQRKTPSAETCDRN
jgi:hypothetical protein